MEGFKPHLKQALINLDTVDRVVRLAPADVPRQYSRDAPQPAVGSHRVWAAELVAELLGPNAPTLDQLVAACDLVPRVADLALSHDSCNSLANRLLAIVRSCLRSKVEALWRPLFEEGFGLDLRPGADAPAPLQRQLAALGERCAGVPPGRRPCLTGCALELTRMLMAAGEAGGEAAHAGVRAVLEADLVWGAAVAPGGSLDALLAEQVGVLCGPLPARDSGAALPWAV
ncbi:MAG: hypothetical protein RJA56_1547 [Pseudomonadota bacterium]